MNIEMEIWASVNNLVYNSVNNSVWCLVRCSVSDSVWRSVDPVRELPWISVNDSIRNNIYSEIEEYEY
jgi:hypothetical protein